MTHEGKDSGNMSFWDHLDVLRASLIKVVVVTLVCSVAAFLFKDEVFAIVLAPKDNDFLLYRLLNRISTGFSLPAEGLDFSVPLINTGLAEQFIIHMKVALYAGFLLSSPYTLYILFRFISPALYEHERKHSVRLVCCGYFMFIAGVLLSYFLIFPLTFRFLGTYQVSSEVTNLITLQSYMDTLLMLSLLMGLAFELPVLCWITAKLGFLSADSMRRWRKHAVVAILIVAAIITPTSDVFTLLLVAAPIGLLYEASILVIAATVRPRRGIDARKTA